MTKKKHIRIFTRRTWCFLLYYVCYDRASPSCEINVIRWKRDKQKTHTIILNSYDTIVLICLLQFAFFYIKLYHTHKNTYILLYSYITILFSSTRCLLIAVKEKLYYILERESREYIRHTHKVHTHTVLRTLAPSHEFQSVTHKKIVDTNKRTKYPHAICCYATST